MSPNINLAPVANGNFPAGNGSQLSAGQDTVVNPVSVSQAGFFPQANVLPGLGAPNSGPDFALNLGQNPIPGFAQGQAPVPAPVINTGATPALESGTGPAFIPLSELMPDDPTPPEFEPESMPGINASLVDSDVRPVEGGVANDFASGPVNVAPAGAKAAHVVVSGAAKSCGLDQDLWSLADSLCFSSFLPPALREVGPDIHAQKRADVYILMQKAKSLGFSPTDAFDRFFVITGKDGFSRLGMYVQAKAAVCARHGVWTISLDAQQAVARVVGHRYDGEQHQVEVSYSGYDAALKGLMRKSTRNGCWEGVGKWADKWPEMLKTRALGRFLDQVFPDLVGGLVSYVDDTDAADLPKETATAIALKEHLVAQAKGIN